MGGLPLSYCEQGGPDNTVNVCDLGDLRIAVDTAAAAAQFSAVCSIFLPADAVPVDSPTPQPLTYGMLLLLAWMQLCNPCRAVTAAAD